MAVVSTEKVYLKRPDGTTVFTKVVKCSSGGEFTITLPVEWEANIGYLTVTAETLYDVEKAFKKAREDNDTATTTMSRVIIYRIKSYGGVSFSTGIAVDYFAGVYDEYATRKADGKMRYEYKYVASSIAIGVNFLDENKPTWGERAKHFLPWTKEREKFFAYIANSLITLIKQLSEVTEDKQKLLDFIDAGRLLSGPKGAE